MTIETTYALRGIYSLRFLHRSPSIEETFLAAHKAKMCIGDFELVKITKKTEIVEKRTVVNIHKAGVFVIEHDGPQYFEDDSKIKRFTDDISKAKVFGSYVSAIDEYKKQGFWASRIVGIKFTTELVSLDPVEVVEVIA